jgi:photosystem II stability/assembly factor-like uncharacterized protein
MTPTGLLRVASGALAIAALACGCSKSADQIAAPGPSNGFVPGWRMQSPQPGTTTFYAVATPDANTVVAVGAGGLIARQAGGGDWEHVSSGTSETLLDVSFANSTDGVAVGKSGTALWTTDGGVTWQLRPPSTSADLHGVHFLIPTFAMVVGASGTILGTTSAGSSWSDLSIDPAQNLYGVHFLHPDTGWVVGADADSGTLLVTTNGGASWERRCCVGTGTINRVEFLGNLGLAVGPSSRLLTRNRGADWLNIAIDDVRPLDAGFADAGKMTVVGFGGSSHQSYSYSFDGGLTWIQPATPGLRHPTTSVSFADATTGWSTGDLGTVLVTEDGGASWQWGSNFPRENLEDVFFLNASEGWVVGPPGIYRTADGGATWVRQRPPAGGGASLSAVWFTSPSTGFAVGAGIEPMLRTSSGGASWSVLTPTPHGLSDIFFLDPNRGWAVGENEILATTDGGDVWQPLDDGVLVWHEYYAVHFADADHGWIAGYEGRLARTENGGASWTTLMVAGSGTRWSGLHFRSATEGWMVGSDNGRGVILHTTDAGDTWEEQHGEARLNLDEVRFLGDAGWAVGELDGVAVILSTTDGGATWADQVGGRYPRGFGLNAISLVDSNIGTAVGNFGLILRTENGGRSE